MNNNTRKKVRGLFLAAALLPLLAVQQVHASEGSVVRRINESTGQKARSLVPENIYGSGSRRSTEQKNGKSGQDVSDATGPGAGGAAEDTFQGPVVEDVRITETYHEDYRLYEEGLGEKAFFYSNIANGTWTVSYTHLSAIMIVRFSFTASLAQIREAARDTSGA